MFTSVMVFVNNSVPREKMGMANGIGQTWASGVRSFGPALGGLLWSVTSNAWFPLHNYIVWIIVMWYARTANKTFFFELVTFFVSAFQLIILFFFVIIMQYDVAIVWMYILISKDDSKPVRQSAH